MAHGHLEEPDTSLFQLLDVVEKRLDSMATAIRYSTISPVLGSSWLTMTNFAPQSDRCCNIQAGSNDATTIGIGRFTYIGLMQIDDMVLKISVVLRKARSIKNCFTRINRIPPETLALAAIFLPKQRDVINATAVCQRWRSTLLSFPRVWRNVGGSLSELEAHLERSKSVPIAVDLSSPQMVSSITLHTFRLEDLTMSVDDSLGFEHIIEHLCDPIPTLRSLKILATSPQLETLQLPPGLSEALFHHLKSLHLFGISSFRGSQPFPHITELSLCTGPSPHRPVTNLLDTFRQLPGLVKVYILFLTDWYDDIPTVNIITLPCLQEICLATIDIIGPAVGGIIPPILQFLELPKATSVVVQSPFPPSPDIAILPDTSFARQLPNYAELPDLLIETTMGSGKVTFIGPSQVAFTYQTTDLADYKRELLLWGGLPISTVRRVIAAQLDLNRGDEDVWLAGVLGQLKSLDRLELGGDCGHVLRRLRRRMLRGIVSVGIDTLIVRGGEYARSQAHKFESVKDEIGLGNTTVTYIPDPGADEGDTDYGNSSDDEDEDEDEGEDNEDEDGDDDDEDE
jgi:hypothetical protein